MVFFFLSFFVLCWLGFFYLTFRSFPPCPGEEKKDYLQRKKSSRRKVYPILVAFLEFFRFTSESFKKRRAILNIVYSSDCNTPQGHAIDHNFL